MPGAEQGAAGRGRWVEAGDLREGDVLKAWSGGEATVTGITRSRRSLEVHNLEIEGCHTYAVHERGILVHNKGAAESGSTVQSVRVYGQIRLDHYEAGILGAEDASALLDWLQRDGYHVTTDAAEVLDAYIREGWAFVAVKLAPGEKRHYDNEMLPALTLAFRGDRLVFPLRISSISTVDTVRMTLYVIGDGTV